VNSREKNTAFIKKLAANQGFDYCGIAAAGYLEDDARRLESWLAQGMHGKMGYMENHFDKRIDPSKLVPGARSVITLLKNYFPEEKMPTERLVSKYAWGKDYHTIIKGHLKTMMEEMQAEIGEFQGRGFVDSAPVLERTWATKSGLGWIGKNGNLINKGSGSFFFIATLITDLDLVYDDPVAKDYCGSCTRCIDACPTDAILPGKTINGSKCISYFTIELKDEIPQEMKGKFGNWMFGCDICQDVCPWNRFSKPNAEPGFAPLPEVLNFTNRDWEELSEETFKKVFKDSPLSRAKYKGISRNLKFISSETDTGFENQGS
jgi:epoxyqueuosine reductase